MTIHDSLLNRVERLAKHIGRTDEIVAGLQQREYDLRHARDGAVRELQQVKADRDDIESKRKVLHEAVNQMFAELSAAAATFWPNDDSGTVAIHTLTGEIQRLREALRTANGRVDLANLSKVSLSEKNANFEAQVNKLKKQLAEAERDSRLGEALQDSMRQNQEIERLREFKKQVEQLLAKPNENIYNDINALRTALFQRAVEQLAERKAGPSEPTPVAEPAPCPDWRAALAELDAGTIQPDPCPECERLRVFVRKVQSVSRGITPATNKLCRICDALAELDAGPSEPTPVAETPDAECGA